MYRAVDLVVDVGTSAIKAACLTATGAIVASSERPFPAPTGDDGRRRPIGAGLARLVARRGRRTRYADPPIVRGPDGPDDPGRHGPHRVGGVAFAYRHAAEVLGRPVRIVDDATWVGVRGAWMAASAAREGTDERFAAQPTGEVLHPRGGDPELERRYQTFRRATDAVRGIVAHD